MDKLEWLKFLSLLCTKAKINLNNIYKFLFFLRILVRTYMQQGGRKGIKIKVYYESLFSKGNRSF